MIIATAGHVDHGKTSLVKALTDVDTDRLEEEKRRGMSIDLGFAYADFGGELPIGFVDVPGHERFIRNMLAGVAAVDFALLVVAADDGPMPQTIEHLAILELLGLHHGAIALTKIDRVSPSRLAEAQAEIVALLASTLLRDAPIFPVASTTGDGMQALRDHLTAANRTMAARPSHGNFRLAVDRSFTLDGAGLVVTGAVFSGSAGIGDQLLVSPQGVPVRVRSIHAQNRPAEHACAGQRCALNLAGADLKRVKIARGDWIIAAAAHGPTARLDVRMHVLASEKRPLAHWTPVHLHSGATAVNARVATLEGRAIAPGESALAQLVLDTSIGALRGDRFIVRDQSAQRTIAGGVVLDPFGPERGRSKPPRIAQLAMMAHPTPVAAFMALLDADPAGINLDRFALAWNLTPDEATLLRSKVPLKVIADKEGLLGIALAHWQALHAQLCATLENWHAAQPESVGPTDTALAARLGQRARPAAMHAAVKSLLESGVVVREGFSLRLPGHRATLSDDDAALLDKIHVALQEGGLRPPIVGELARTLAMEQTALVDFLTRVSLLGHLVRVAKNRFFQPATITALAQIAAQLAGDSEDGTFDAAAYRDRSGIGRNLTIQVLEFLDRAGVTCLAGDRRSMAT